MKYLPDPQPSHPGFLIQRLLVEGSGMTARTMALHLGLSPAALHYVLHGRNGITASTAVRLEAMFGVPAKHWLELQSEYDIAVAERNLAGELAEIAPYAGPGLNLDGLFDEEPNQANTSH
jgi:antitoxin HigA-1